MEIRSLDHRNMHWAESFMRKNWGGDFIVSRGKTYYIQRLKGYVAYVENEPKGIIAYNHQGRECEIILLESLLENRGIGTQLIKAVEDTMAKQKCERIWLITTNDNLHALGFYQKRGYSLVAIHRNALEVSRRIKPQIPLIGMDGIPLRDEIELEKRLDTWSE